MQVFKAVCKLATIAEWWLRAVWLFLVLIAAQRPCLLLGMDIYWIIHARHYHKYLTCMTKRWMPMPNSKRGSVSHLAVETLSEQLVLDCLHSRILNCGKFRYIIIIALLTSNPSVELATTVWECLSGMNSSSLGILLKQCSCTETLLAIWHGLLSKLSARFNSLVNAISAIMTMSGICEILVERVWDYCSDMYHYC